MSAPWTTRYLLVYPTTHLVPLVLTAQSVFRPPSRLLWLCYWSLLCVVEYLEGIVFGENVRALRLYPRVSRASSVQCTVLTPGESGRLFGDVLCVGAQGERREGRCDLCE